MEGAPLPRILRKKLDFVFYQVMCRRRLWKWVTLSTEAPLGKHGGGSLTEDFEEKMRFCFLSSDV